MIDRDHADVPAELAGRALPIAAVTSRMAVHP